jgi:hypothetical protein
VAMTVVCLPGGAAASQRVGAALSFLLQRELSTDDHQPQPIPNSSFTNCLPLHVYTLIHRQDPKNPFFSFFFSS